MNNQNENVKMCRDLKIAKSFIDESLLEIFKTEEDNEIFDTLLRKLTSAQNVMESILSSCE